MFMGSYIARRYKQHKSAVLVAPGIASSYSQAMDTVEETRRKKLIAEVQSRGYGGQAQIGRAIGVSSAQIQQWIKGVRAISSESARRLEKALGHPTGWMDQSEPPFVYMMGTDSDIHTDPETEAIFANLTRQKEEASSSNTAAGPSLRPAVPLISWVQAGNWTECHDPYPPGVADEWINPSTRVSACAFALSVRGDSMEPRFVEGDTIIVDPELEARTGDFVIVRLDDAQEATFKQLVIDGPQRFLKPLNARYPVIPINGNATVVGVVVEKRQVFLR